MARKKYTTELRELLEKIPEDKKSIASRLADELVFMLETLEDLKKQIRETGTIEDFKQGKQEFKRESPALKSYNMTLKQYSSIYKQITDLLPKDVTTTRSNAIYDFMKED